MTKPKTPQKIIPIEKNVFATSPICASMSEKKRELRKTSYQATVNTLSLITTDNHANYCHRCLYGYIETSWCHCSTDSLWCWECLQAEAVPRRDTVWTKSTVRHTFCSKNSQESISKWSILQWVNWFRCIFFLLNKTKFNNLDSRSE